MSIAEVGMNIKHTYFGPKPFTYHVTALSCLNIKHITNMSGFTVLGPLTRRHLKP